MGTLNRTEMIAELKSAVIWDVLVIGGGATGLGIALDAASRGFRTLLVEQSDFAKGTSSRSTKLVHGGVRYLEQGNLSLVMEALKERGILCQNAPHLVSHLPFLVPNYRWWEGFYYGAGLKVYDLLAGRLGIEKSERLSQEETLRRIPTLKPDRLRGGVVYYDGQFDDARLAIALAQTAVDEGAVVVNYTPVIRFIKEKGRLRGAIVRDEESGEEVEIFSRTVINATGVFSDSVRRLDGEKRGPIIAPSQGIHLVFDRSFLPSDTAVMIPKTDDGRVLFFIPWLGHVLMGTTDTPVKQIVLEPKPLQEEIDFLLNHAKRYLTRAPGRDDVLSVFAGLRPLVKKGESKNTAALSRNHRIVVADSGLITIAGGKWTTYRKMAEDAVDRAILVGRLGDSPCRTKTLRLQGYGKPDSAKDDPGAHRRLHPSLPYSVGDISWAAKQEMARTLEDALARRTRSLFLNVKASLEIAPEAARIMARELGYDEEWEKRQLAQYTELAKNYSTGGASIRTSSFFST
ncbi:MAG: glycerol-3-phosphate dehydrogenase/oxidase [Chlamydiales bacterium]